LNVPDFWPGYLSTVAGLLIHIIYGKIRRIVNKTAPYRAATATQVALQTTQSYNPYTFFMLAG